MPGVADVLHLIAPGSVEGEFSRPRLRLGTVRTVVGLFVLLSSGRTPKDVRVGTDDMTPPSAHTVAMRPRLLIVDDHDGFRSIARAMLEGDGYDVVGEAVDGATASSAARSLEPGIVLLDIHLPDIDGFAVSEALARLPDPPAVVLISSRPLADIRQRVSASPAVGFIFKDQLTGEAVAALTG